MPVKTPDGQILIEPASHAHRTLMALKAQSLHGEALSELFGVKPSEISRQTRQLKDLGLIVGTRHGRRVYWALTSAGEQVLEQTTERERHDESLLLAVEYRVVPLKRGRWALERVVVDGGRAHERKSVELTSGSYDSCLKSWKSLRRQAEELSAAERKLRASS